MLAHYYSRWTQWTENHIPLEVEAPPDQHYENYLDNQLDEHAQGECPPHCLFCKMELESLELPAMGELEEEKIYDTLRNNKL